MRSTFRFASIATCVIAMALSPLAASAGAPVDLSVSGVHASSPEREASMFDFHDFTIEDLAPLSFAIDSRTFDYADVLTLLIRPVSGDDPVPAAAVRLQVDLALLELYYDNMFLESSALTRSAMNHETSSSDALLISALNHTEAFGHFAHGIPPGLASTM